MVTRYLSWEKPATKHSDTTVHLKAVSDELPPDTIDNWGNESGPGWYNTADLHIRQSQPYETVIRSSDTDYDGPYRIDKAIGEASKSTGLDPNFIADVTSSGYDSIKSPAVENLVKSADSLLTHLQRRQFNPEDYKPPTHENSYDGPPTKIPSPYHQARKAGIRYAKAVSEVNKSIPMEFFHHTPGQTTITDAFADPDMRVHMPLLASYAHMKYVPEGQSITASDDLSPYSSNMVKKAQKLGLPVVTHSENPDAAVTNDSELVPYRMHADSLNYYKTLGMQDIPQEDLSKAWDHYRMLRGRPAKGAKPVMSEQFKDVPHPQLPGMEGY